MFHVHLHEELKKNKRIKKIKFKRFFGDRQNFFYYARVIRLGILQGILKAAVSSLSLGKKIVNN